MVRFKPISDYHYIEYTEVPEKTTGGIYLPDRLRRNYTEGVVVSSGDGGVLGGINRRSLLWARAGDIVVFERHNVRLIGGQLRRGGLIRDRDLIAVVRLCSEGEDLVPLNDWVKVERFPAPIWDRGIELPEWSRRRLLCGRIIAVGPGRLDTYNLGARVPCRMIMGLGEEPIGGIAYWGERARSIDIGDESRSWTFIRAGDIDCVQQEA
ncbi:MAG: co-chaperone GroES family protein [bacterium JZ-2024 1]